MHLPLPPSGDSVEPQALAALWQHVEGCKPLCVVMSPEHSRLLDLAVDIAATHMRNARHFVCITPTNSPLCHAGCTKALRSIQGVYTAIADGCTFGCRCAVTEHLVAAGWQFVTTLPRLAMRMQRRCAGVHIHVQQAFSQRMPARMRRAIATSIRQTRDRLETAQLVAGVDDMSREESADVLGRPHSSVQTSFRRLHVNLGHPKKTSWYVTSGTHTRLLKLWKLHETSNALPAKLLNIPVWHDSLLHVKSSSPQNYCHGCEGTARVDTG